MSYPAWPLMALLLIAVSPTPAADLRYLQSIGDAEYHHVESELLGRGYHVYVALPAGCEEETGRTYPAIYVLDGGELFPLLASYYRYLNFGEEVPDSIIVGISYGGDTAEEGNYRSTDYTAPSDERDYWGGVGTFQSFLPRGHALALY